MSSPHEFPSHIAPTSPKLEKPVTYRIAECPSRNNLYHLASHFTHFVEPIKVLEPLKDVIVNERETITLQCKISKNKVKAVWKKDGEVMRGSMRADLQQEGQKHRLTVSSSELSDIGKYSVTFDEEVTLEANVDIKGK